jgi:hypothetical protein
MTSQFKVHLHRYDPKRGESRKSGPIWVHARDFHDACEAAERYRYGAEAADPDRTYVVASVEHWGLRGEECKGARLFETAEELSERVAAGKA